MSLTITITDLTNLTDTERAVLRFVADRATANSLKETVRGMCTGDGSGETLPDMNNDLAYSSGHQFDVPVEPEEVYSPHAVVPDTPPAPVTPPIPALAPFRPHENICASAELDAAGLPWDKRIHASTRTKVAAGTWKYARGVADDYIAQVERELRAVQNIPAPAVSNVAPDGFDNTPVPYTAPAAVAPTPIVPLPPVPAAPTAALPMTFAQLMQHITPMLVSGKLTQPMLQGVVGTLGLPHLAALGARPDLVETVRAAIDEAVGGVQ